VFLGVCCLRRDNFRKVGLAVSEPKRNLTVHVLLRKRNLIKLIELGLQQVRRVIECERPSTRITPLYDMLGCRHRTQRLTPSVSGNELPLPPESGSQILILGIFLFVPFGSSRVPSSDGEEFRDIFTVVAHRDRTL
jgi:hypothetical protein